MPPKRKQRSNDGTTQQCVTSVENPGDSTAKHSETAGGNTGDSPAYTEWTATLRSRGWCFTKYGYDDKWVRYVTHTLEEEKGKYAMQEEICPKSGRPHIQGVLWWPNDRTGASIKQNIDKTMHWGRTKSVLDSVKYCTDPAKRAPLGRLWLHGWEDPHGDWDIIKDLEPWQQEIIAIIDGPYNPRIINWIVDEEGGKGKSDLVRYLLFHRPKDICFFTGGSKEDIGYQVMNFKGDPTACIFDIPRDREGKISYAALEMLKNGLVQSGKYEGGYRMFRRKPHVIVMANWRPNMSKMSEDRWNIIEI